MKRLKIVQAIFTGGFAGSERMVAELSNSLAERHDVLLLMSTDSPEEGTTIQAYLSSKVRVKRIPGFMRAARVVFETWKFKADIYHAHLGRAVRYAKFILPPAKRVATWHMARPVVADGLDALVLISPWQKDLKRKGNRSPKIAVVSNWAAHFESPPPERREALKAELGIRKDEFVLGFVGRPARRKKLKEALQAFQEWDSRDATFVVVGGEANQDPELEPFTRDPRIRFLGHRKDVYDFYSIMDCVVFPATNEAFGLVAIEAMRAGCQLIVHNSHGLKDIASANPGVIAIDADRPGQLQQAYDAALGRRGKAPEYNMSLYDPDQRISDLENLYLELLEAS